MGLEGTRMNFLPKPMPGTRSGPTSLTWAALTCILQVGTVAWQEHSGAPPSCVASSILCHIIFTGQSRTASAENSSCASSSCAALPEPLAGPCGGRKRCATIVTVVHGMALAALSKAACRTVTAHVRSCLAFRACVFPLPYCQIAPHGVDMVVHHCQPGRLYS